MKVLLQPCNQAPRCHKTLLKNHGNTSLTSLEDDYTADSPLGRDTNVSAVLVMTYAAHI